MHMYTVHQQKQGKIDKYYQILKYRVATYYIREHTNIRDVYLSSYFPPTPDET